jgi:hypothetical protein
MRITRTSSRRIKGLTKKDADNNAIIILNAFAQMLAVELEDGLNSLEYLFDTDQTPSR